VDYVRARDMKYRTAELKILAVANPHIDSTTALPSRTIFGTLMQTLDMVRRQTEITQGSSRPGSSQMRMMSMQAESNQCIMSLLPNATLHWLLNKNSKPVEPISFYSPFHPKTNYLTEIGFKQINGNSSGVAR
jgi:hypothetical protein